MTTQEAKQIDIPSYLGSLGFYHKFTRKGGRELWYPSPFRPQEKNASFKITLGNVHSWYDFGIGAGGNILDFVMMYNNCMLSDALKILDNGACSLPITANNTIIHEKKQHKILSIKKIGTTKDLTNYLTNQRKIPLEIGQKYLVEVHYKYNRKKYQAIGMKTHTGYETRNPRFKGTIGGKSSTKIKGKSNKHMLSIFEGMLDFLSLLTMKNTVMLKGDVIVLHSTSQLKKEIESIKNYKKVFTFLDNDAAGRKAYEQLLTHEIEFIPMNDIYEGYKDLNECLTL